MQQFNLIADGVGAAVCSLQLAFRTMLGGGPFDNMAVCQWTEGALMGKHKQQYDPGPLFRERI